MREDLKVARPTKINVSNKEKVNMKLAVGCELLWAIQVEGGYDIELTTSWRGEGTYVVPMMARREKSVQVVGLEDEGRSRRFVREITVYNPPTYTHTQRTSNDSPIATTFSRTHIHAELSTTITTRALDLAGAEAAKLKMKDLPRLNQTYGKVMSKRDLVTIPGPGTYSLLLDNSYSWLNSKVVTLTYVTATSAAASKSEEGSTPKSTEEEEEAAGGGEPPKPPRRDLATVGRSASLQDRVRPSGIEGWSVDAVASWLESVNLGQYKSSVTKHRIDGKCLRRLVDFSPKDQAEYVQSQFDFTPNDALRLGFELGQVA